MGFDVRHVGHNGAIVAQREKGRRPEAAWAATWPTLDATWHDAQQVRAGAGELIIDVILDTRADGEERDDRADANADADQRKEGAQAIRADGAQRQPNCLSNPDVHTLVLEIR